MEELRLEDIQETIAIIKINKSYHSDMSALELYDVTRGCWKRKLESVQIADVVLAVSFGEVVEVYHADKWVPADELNRETIPFDAELEKGRIGFIGTVADENIRNKYIGKSVAGLYKRGEADPVKIVRPDEWFPSNYTPGFSVEQWMAMLQDESLFHESSLQIMKRMKDIGGQATCIQLVNKYGKSVGFYISGVSSLAKRIVDRTGCPVLEEDNENAKWWPVLFVGKHASKNVEGSYIWKLRDELSAALDRVDLSAVELYALDKVDDINNALPPTSISGTTVICPRCNEAFIKAARCPECGQLIKYE